jgi:hypothetical protein
MTPAKSWYGVTLLLFFWKLSDFATANATVALAMRIANPSAATNAVVAQNVMSANQERFD